MVLPKCNCIDNVYCGLVCTSYFQAEYDSVTIRFVCIVRRDRPASEVQLQHSKIKSIEWQQLGSPNGNGSLSHRTRYLRHNQRVSIFQ